VPCLIHVDRFRAAEAVPTREEMRAFLVERGASEAALI
jgi:hypothetical protein